MLFLVAPPDVYILIYNSAAQGTKANRGAQVTVIHIRTASYKHLYPTSFPATPENFHAHCTLLNLDIFLK